MFKMKAGKAGVRRRGTDLARVYAAKSRSTRRI